MNEPKEQKIYVPKSSAKQITFPKSGKTIIKLGLHAETMIAFIKANANEKGYINLGISERKSESQYGDTHCVWLDAWKPDMNKMRREVAPKVEPAKESDDSIPF